jgi:hypothetical protein
MMANRKSFWLELAAVFTLLLAMPMSASALVKYDEGRIQILGVQLLQDFDDPNKYYYLPQYPRIAETTVDGETSLDFICIKYIGTEVNGTDTVSGGLFHALVDFRLPPELEEELKAELDELRPGATLEGPVPLKPADEETLGMASFRVVSATLSNDTFSSQVVSSGRAPLTSGSKAAIAASLDSAGATLLWDSFRNGSTSDVSIAVSGYYDASVKAYNARVYASTENIYKHVSKVMTDQSGFRKRELRKIVDDMHRDQILEVEVFDQSKALGLNNSGMETILNLVTEKLTDAMFDRKTGLSKDPEQIKVEPTTPRVKRGWLGRLFRGSGNQRYVTDDRYVLKNIENIKVATFSLVLNRTTVVKVPFDSTGNLGGFFAQNFDSADDASTQYFREVSLVDPAFAVRSVQFLVDGDYVEAFADKINAVSFQFNRPYANGAPAYSNSAVFNYKNVAEGDIIRDFTYPRAGDSESNWLSDFGQYRIVWNLRDVATPLVYPGPDSWAEASGTVVSLTPPFTRQDVRLVADTELLREAGIQRGVVKFGTVIAGVQKQVATAEILTDSADPTQMITIYHDRGEPIFYRTTWYAKAEKRVEGTKRLDGDYIYLAPETEGVTP